MIKKAWLNLSLLTDRHRLALWVLLVSLTTLILGFPVQLKYEYHPLHYSYIFGNNFPLFVALYVIWMLLLMVLILSRREAKWEKLALVGIFAVVFLGFRVINTPLFIHQDEWYHAAHVQYLLQYGEINLTHWLLGYFQWPALHLNASTLSQITGLSIFDVRAILGIFEALLLSALFYVLLLRFLRNPAISALGVVLLMLGNIIIGRNTPFYPEAFSYLFLALFLVLLNRHENIPFETWPDRLLMIIVLLAISITHLITSLAIVFILAAIIIVQRIGGRTRLIAENMVILSIVIVTAWQMYWALRAFAELTMRLPLILNDISFYNILFSAQVATSTTISPLWAIYIKFFWWVFVYAFGSILWLKSLFALKKLSPLEKKNWGGLAGIIVLTIILTLAGQGGVQLARYVKYAPFFTIPIILLFFSSRGGPRRKYGIVLTAVLLFALSLPTFLVYNQGINTATYYPSEVSGSKFLKSTYGEGEELYVYSDAYQGLLNTYYLPQAYISGGEDILYSQGANFKEASQLWPVVNLVVDRFINWSGDRKYAVYVYSKRLVVTYEGVFGFEPTHPEWLKLKNKLSGENLVYDNGDYEIYIPARPRE